MLTALQRNTNAALSGVTRPIHLEFKEENAEKEVERDDCSLSNGDVVSMLLPKQLS